MNYRVDSKKWREDWQDVQWRWVIVAGVVISLATVVTIAAIIASYSGYVFATNPEELVENSASIDQFARPVAEFGSTIAQLIYTFFVSAWVVRRVGTAVNLHGSLFGIMSGIGLLIQAVVFSGEPQLVLRPFSVMITFLVLITFGQYGARRGYRHIVTQEKFYKSAQAIQRATTPQSIVNSIGNNLSRPDIVHVGLWEILLQGSHGRPASVLPLDVWSTYKTSTGEFERYLTQEHLPNLSQLDSERPLFAKVGDSAIAETAVWKMLGVRSLMIIPLVAPVGNWVGLLTIGSQASSGFSQSAEQDYVAISTHVALVLDNLRLLDQAKETGVLQERQRMAREIHDTLAQGFTSIVMHLEAAEQSLLNDAATAQHHLNQARQTARNSLGQARRVVEALRPEVLESAPLHEAINRVVAAWEVQTGIPALFETIGQNENLHPELEVTLLRGTQEALANVRKHANASEVQVTLSYLKDVVILDVADNGIGFILENNSDGKREERREKRNYNLDEPDDELVKGGYGLVAMNERVAELGGEVTIESEPNEGTTVAISIPLVNEHHDK